MFPKAIARRVLCGLALGAGLSATAADTYDAMMAEVRRDCVKAAPAWPGRDQPPAGAKPCDSTGFCYGIDKPVDYAQARLCAFAEPDLGVLAMLYANGQGVTRDYGVARKAVCDDRDAALRRAQEAFVDARDGEVDKTGSARASMLIAEEEGQRDAWARARRRWRRRRTGA